VTGPDIKSVPLLSSIGLQAANDLVGLLEVRDEKPGSRIFARGDAGDAMYFIEKGRVRIHFRDADGRDATLADLREGDFFGEMSLLNQQPRSADATASEPTRLATLSRAHFVTFLRRNPDVAIEMLASIADRLRRTDEMVRQRVSRNLNEEISAHSSLADRMADRIAEFGGSWRFIGFTLLLLSAWMLFNSWLLHDKGFDPFPYILLNLALGVMTGLQAPVIMMSQNRQSEKDRLRANLDYQVNLKNEISLAEVLRRLDTLENLIDRRSGEAASGQAPDHIENR
jgi:CRP/FNR family cyclic AMP-dependent transcriptional regulator